MSNYKNYNILNIGHYADIQAKVRSKDLTLSFRKSLNSIVNIINLQRLDVVVIAGDIFEYDEPNDIERELIYHHIIDVLKIPSVKELVIMLGNHDYNKHQTSNPISILEMVINEIDDNKTLKSKINYLQKSVSTPSIINNDLVWLPYSLEDKSISWKMLYKDILFSDDNKMYIGVFHDILLEYVDDKKLPVRNKSRLMQRSDFLCDYIFAGDIHELWDCNGFHYPGSTLERNHGEGAYIIFGGNKNVTELKAPGKYILSHNVDVANKKIISTNKHLISNDLKYHTIDLSTTSTVDGKLIEFVVDNYFNSIIGTNNIIKIKLSSENQKHRTNLITQCSGFTDYEIEIQDIKSIVNNNNIDLVNGQLDDYVLSQDKIVELFKLGLAAVDDGTTVFRDVKEDVINMFAGNLDMIFDAEKSYNIELLNISTNGFQILGQNSVNLDIFGLTRIKGSNKVGKTTMYLMMNFLRYGKVYNQLKNNTKKYNNSLVFNNKLPDNNHVNVTLNSRINGLDVKISRDVYRTWKETATKAEKLLKNNLNYVSSLKQKLTVEIFDKETGDVKHKIEDDKAEVLLNRWFGDSVNNLLIIDDVKLKNLLNLPTDKLEKLLLDYIGNNFIETMIQGLPIIKDKLLSDKPTKSDKVLNDEIANYELNINNLRLSNKQIIDINNESVIKLDKYNDDKDVKNNELVNIGNVPMKIADIQKVIDKYNNIIDNHQAVEYKKLPEKPTTVAPVTPNYGNGLTFNEKKKQINDAITKFRDETTALTAKNATIVNDLHTNINTTSTKLLNSITNTTNEYKQNKLIESNGIKDKINEHQYWLLLKTKIDETKVLYDGEVFNKNETNRQVSDIDKEISILENEISSGVCGACNQTLQDVDEESIRNKKLKLVTLKTNRTNTVNDITRLDVLINDYNTTINNLQSIYNDKKIVSVDGIDENVFNELNTLNNDLTVKTNEINKLNAKPFNELMEFVCPVEYKQHVTINQYIDELLNFNKTNDYTVMCDLLQEKFVDHKINTEKINNNNATIDKLNNAITHIDDINNKYVDDVTKYNEINSTYNTDLANVNEANRLITEKNKSYEEAKLLITQPLVDIKRLQTNDLLTYNEITEKIKYLNDNIVEVNKLIDDNKQLINTNENNINIMEEKISENKDALVVYNQWNIRKTTYKYYELMIKSVLGKSIFNYYRNSINFKFNELLENVNFDLEWNVDGNLYKIEYNNQTGEKHYTNVIGASGMETCFLGLSLIYSISELNQKHRLSHIFIDEISGKLNSGEDNNNEQDKTNYQEMLLLLLNKFNNSKIFIVDHVIKNMYESQNYDVVNINNQSYFKTN